MTRHWDPEHSENVMPFYDFIFIGAGPGGYQSALYAASKGASVCLIERDEVGGTCLNRGCIPSKTLFESAKAAYTVKTAKALGLSAELNGIDLDVMVGRKNDVVNRIRSGLIALLNAKRVAILKGTGRISGKGEVEAGGGIVKGRGIVIATGSSPSRLKGFEFDGRHIFSAEQALDIDKKPASVTIIGAGAVGCEFAQFYNKIGSRVALVEAADRVLPMLDGDISGRLESVMLRDGIAVITAARPMRHVLEGDGVSVELEDGRRLRSDIALVSVGRSPNSGGIGLENAGVKTDKDGWIVTDGFLSCGPGVYAIGDVKGGMMLAHTAAYEGMCVVDTVLSGKSKAPDYSGIPYCIYTDPEITSVGPSEDALKKTAAGAVVVKLPFTVVGRTHTLPRTEGVFKLALDKGSGNVIAIHICGPHASELSGEASLIVSNSMKIADIRRAVHAHPTLSEIFAEAAYKAEGTPIHTL